MACRFIPRCAARSGVLTGCPHAHAPAAEPQECKEGSVDQGSHKNDQCRTSRDARSAKNRKRRIGEAERLQGVLLRRRPDEHDKAPQKDTKRDRGQDCGEHHFTGHSPHQNDIDQDACRDAHQNRDDERRYGMVREDGCSREQEVGPQHAQLAMRHVHDAAHPINQHIPAREQRVYRREHDDVDGELHESGIRCQLSGISHQGTLRP